VIGTKILRKRKIIVDVDTQKHFFHDDGPICVQNHQYVLDNIRKVTAWARMKHIHMISTLQIPPRNIIHEDSRIVRCLSLNKIKGTLHDSRISYQAADCTDVTRELFDKYNQVILYKRTFDPFEEPRADRMFTELEVDEFILIGALVEGAIKATALGLLARWKKVTVLLDATGSLNASARKLALKHLWAKGAKIIDTQQFLGTFATQTGIPHLSKHRISL
jgi:nicotinamidase-related amidase